MEEKLTKQDQVFVKEIVEHGNQTEAARKAYGIKNEGYARVKGHKQLTKNNIVKAIQTLADRISDDKLHEVLEEGLDASQKLVKDGQIIAEIPDHNVRHKFLDTAIKLKGLYAPEKNINLNIEVDTNDPHARSIAEEYEQKLKESL